MDSEFNDVQAGAGSGVALPFIYGHVDPTLFPIDQLKQSNQEALSRFGNLALNYGIEQGCGLLLAYLQSKLARDEGVDIPRENIVLMAGASGAIDAICRLFTQPGDTVLVEAPTYHEAVGIVRDYPVRIKPVPIDDEGLIVDALADQIDALVSQGNSLGFLYTIPTFQNPSGVTLSHSRRKALLELARRKRLLIVEDDVYRDLFYDNPPPPSLYTLDSQAGGNSVLRLGSFSKILGPGLRLGWLTGPAPAIERITGSGLFTSGGGMNPYTAFTIGVFCQNGWLEPHVARLKTAYGRRRGVMLQALGSAMPSSVSWTRPGGGFFIWLSLPDQLLAKDVLVAANRESINFLTGEPFFVGGGGGHHMRLPFSFIAPEDMADGILQLGEIVSDLLDVGG